MESTGVFVQTPLLKSAQTVILKHSGHSLCKKALSVDESRPFLWSFVSESFGHCYFQIQCLDFFFLFQWFFILFYFLHCAFEPSEAFKGLSMKPLKAPCYNPWHDIQWSAGPEGNLKLCEGSLSTSVFTASPPPPIAQISPESFAFAPEGGRAVFHFGHRHKCGSPGAINAFSDLSGNNNNNNSGAIAQNAQARIPCEGPAASVQPPRAQPSVRFSAKRRLDEVRFSHRSRFFFFLPSNSGE